MNMVILSESDGKIFMVIFIIAIGMQLQFVAGCLVSSLIRVVLFNSHRVEICIEINGVSNTCNSMYICVYM